MTVFLCGEETEDIFSAIYDSGTCGLSPDQLRIGFVGEDPELFCEYREVKTDPDKVKKVITTIKSRLSEELYETVFKAALSQNPSRADQIYRFLLLAFKKGKKVTSMLQEPSVFSVFDMVRNLGIEYNHMQGFTRFSRMQDGILLAKIGPKNDLTILLADFFADRLRLDPWIIYDVKRKKLAVYQPGKGYVIVKSENSDWERRMEESTDEEEFRKIWKAFCSHISIKERENPICQRTMLPYRFRPYMTEFQD